MNANDVIELLKQRAVPSRLEGMARYGIQTSKALGVTIPELRSVAKGIGKNHQLASDLWETGIHECRILASMIGDTKSVTHEQMDQWVDDFDSWDVCDQVCGNLFDRTPFAISKALEYCGSEKEFVKRAGFVLIAESAVHNKTAPDEVFAQFFPFIEREAWDDRNFVKKAVNWALRQIGKRNKTLQALAIEYARRIMQQNSKAARWIARDALAELEQRFKD